MKKIGITPDCGMQQYEVEKYVDQASEPSGFIVVGKSAELVFPVTYTFVTKQLEAPAAPSDFAQPI